KRIDGTIMVVDKAIYTACEPCEEDPDSAPTWRIKTGRTIHNQQTQTIIYEDARIELMGIPVFYLPYFSQPDTSVDKRSGFLTPRFGLSSDLGTEISLPYFINLAPSYDLTVTPRLTTKAGNLLELEWRQKRHNGAYRINGNGVWLNESENLDNNRSFRGNIKADGRFSAEREGWHYGFKVEQVTDDTFLRRYNISSQNYLETAAYLEYLEDRNFINIRAVDYDTTLASIDNATLSSLAPHIQMEIVPERKIADGHLSFTADFMSMTRVKGVDVMRGIIETGWTRYVHTDNGQSLKFFANLQSSLYATEGLPKYDGTGETYGNDTRSQLRGHIGMQWNYPFVKYGTANYHIIEPIAQLVLLPNTKNDPRIPNEDSRSVDFDSTNLFTPERFTGYDRHESGGRLDYGLRYMMKSDKGRQFSVFAGQSLRNRKNNLFRPGSGLDGTKSDIVLDFSLMPNAKYSFDNRLRLDKSSLEIVRSEADIFVQFARGYARLGYVFLDERISSDGREREELRASASTKVINNWWLDGTIRQDMFRGTRLHSGIGITYRDDCLYIRLGLTQDYTRDRNIGPSNGFTLQLHLKTLGGVATSSSMLENMLEN
ncbi:MAG: LPS assembly protein LptD, partial [Alphaproteobacteria bacterium]|nr:LPS assembly protein LptD [Alphaproteobacteria bacterium]